MRLIKEVTFMRRTKLLLAVVAAIAVSAVAGAFAAPAASAQNEESCTFLVNGNPVGFGDDIGPFLNFPEATGSDWGFVLDEFLFGLVVDNFNTLGDPFTLYIYPDPIFGEFPLFTTDPDQASLSFEFTENIKT
jgi:hypothetical protein